MKNWYPHPDDLDWDFDDDEQEVFDIPNESRTIPWEEALELNKTRDNCVVCGKPTKLVPLFTGSIRTCPCLDDLRKQQDEDKNK